MCMMSIQTFITLNNRPGPACSVEERSLRKIRVRGPGFDPRRGLLFRRNLFSRKCFAQMFDGKSNYRTGSSNLATSTSKAVVDISTTV